MTKLVNEAISLYFAGASRRNRDINNGSALANEARRQSLLVSEHVPPSEGEWEANIDDTEWVG